MNNKSPGSIYKPFYCNLCGRRFKTNAGRSQHIGAVHGRAETRDALATIRAEVCEYVHDGSDPGDVWWTRAVIAIRHWRAQAEETGGLLAACEVLIDYAYEAADYTPSPNRLARILEQIETTRDLIAKATQQ